MTSSSLSRLAIKRIQKEIQDFGKNKHESIFLKMVDENLSHFHALIIAPEDCLYVGGFFFFDIVIDPQYPINPPKVKFLSSYQYSGLRIHPNLYNDISGKVCLSILNQWQGNTNEQWKPSSTLQTLLFTIQALLDDNPMSHEPAYNNIKITDPTAINYAFTARIGNLHNIYQQLSDTNHSFHKEMVSYFIHHFPLYEKSCAFLTPHAGNSFTSFHIPQGISYSTNVLAQLTELFTFYSTIPKPSITDQEEEEAERQKRDLSHIKLSEEEEEKQSKKSKQ